MAKRKPGRKAKAVKDLEATLLEGKYRVGELIAAVEGADEPPAVPPEGASEADLAEYRDLQADWERRTNIRQSLRLTGAEIAWIRLVAIARAGIDADAKAACKTILDRTFGAVAPKESKDAAGGTSFTVVIK